jgi:hypothetical protein
MTVEALRYVGTTYAATVKSRKSALFRPASREHNETRQSKHHKTEEHLMEHTEFPSNRVVIVGMLDPQRRRNQVIAASTRRTLQGGRVTEFNLQVDSPFGEPFAVSVTTGVQTMGVELLDEAHSGQPLAVEGVLQTRINLDPRYAIADDDPGRSSRALSLRATRIREPRDDDPCGATAVWLEGAIGAEPRFGTHRSAAAVELARTIVRVRWRRPSGYPGSQAVLVEEADVNVSVPLELPGASYLLVSGNRVRLVGQLDSVPAPIQGRSVSERLEQLAADWRERKGQIEDDAAARTALLPSRLAAPSTDRIARGGHWRDRAAGGCAAGRCFRRARQRPPAT